MVTDGRAAGAASLRRAVDAFLGDELADDEFVQWGHLATSAACHALGLAELGALERASTSSSLGPPGRWRPCRSRLNGRGVYTAWCGDVEATTALIAEYDAVNEATGIGWYSACGLLQAAYQGRPEALALIDGQRARTPSSAASARASQFATWTRAIVCNGLGRYAEALAAAELAAYEMEIPNGTGWALPELIEAAVQEPPAATSPATRWSNCRSTRSTTPTGRWASRRAPGRW